MKHLLLSISLCGLTGLIAAQSLTPSVVATTGGSGTVAGASLDWTLGELVVPTLDDGAHELTQGFQQADPVRLRLRLAAALQGPYSSSTGLMLDALRAQATFPLTEPYTALGYVHVGGGAETIAATVLAVSGNDAIVDWVLLELRSAANSSVVLGSRSALLQRDGDVVETDGTGAVVFAQPPGLYHVAVRHRNHLGVMTALPLELLAGENILDLRLAGTATYGTEARKSISGTFPVEALWAGDVTFNGRLRYTGSGNDRDPILTRIGGSVPTAVVTGYWREDCNLDGSVKYTGGGNDRDVILLNIGGSVPTATRNAQLPELP
jgi:hypothetical protein